MKKTFIRKPLSVLLSILMALSVFSVTAFAGPPGDTGDGIGTGTAHTHNDITFEPWESTTTLPDSGSYYLTADVTLTEFVMIEDTLDLCLNGHNVTLAGENTVIAPVGGTFNLYDDTNIGSIICGTGLDGDGGAIYVFDGAVYMYGGTITGGNVSRNGGAVKVTGDETGSTFQMFGGAISGNAAGRSGGAVYVDSESVFHMYGGVISDNTATLGGGVYVTGDSTFIMEDGAVITGNTARAGGGVYHHYGTFEMNGGSIVRNTAPYHEEFDSTNGIGGGIYAGADVLLNGGVITENTAHQAGGIFSNMMDPDYALRLSGGSVTGNTADIAANILTIADSPIVIAGALPEDSSFGVTLVDADVKPTEGVFTSGLSGNGSLDNFVNENGAGFEMSLNDDGEAQFVAAAPATYTVTWKNGDDPIEIDEGVAYGTSPSFDGTAPAKAADTYYTYAFSGWRCGDTTYGLNDTLPPVTGDATYTATFTPQARTFMIMVKKLTGATINVYDVTGETTVAQVKEMVADKAGIPASEQRLIFAGKTLADDKTLSEYNVQKESTLHVVGKAHTITWLNDDSTLIDTTSLSYGAVPTHDDPTKEATAQYTYEFAGWNDGETTYAPDALPAVTGDVTYTATFTQTVNQAAIDAAAAAAVDELINAIGEVTLDSKDAIDEARAAYDALTDAQKALVSNYETLQLAEGQYAALQLAADMTAFEAYKTAKNADMDDLLQEGDSDTVQSIVGLAKTAIDGAQYDESKTLDENKAALDTLGANVPNAVA